MEESLRREIESYVESRLSSIKHEVAQLQTQLNESLKRVLESEGEGQWDGSLAASVAEHLRAAHERGVELAASESTRTQASSDMAIVKAAIEEMEAQTSQAETLKTLVNRASAFAPRVVFFVVKGDQARGWRARGLEGSIGDSAVQQISLSLSAETMIGEVVRTRRTWSGTPDAHSEDELVWQRLGEEAPQRIVSVPLVVRGRAVAVLYADSAGLDSDAINLEALETLAKVAGMAVGMLAAVAQTSAPAKEALDYQEQVSPVEETASYAPTREYEEPAADQAAEAPAEQVVEGSTEELPIVEPVAVSSEAEIQTEQPQVVEPADSFNVSEPELPEAAVVYGSSAPEPAAGPAGSRRRYGTYDAALPVDVNDEDERRQHQDARRFARLLVSEIKLYNEPKVLEGRAQGNLYERLKEYVDRSREMYDKRVKPNITARYDYFHNELVNTLAEGDASKLGEAYPGTPVTA